MKYKHIMLVFGVSAAISVYLRLKEQLTTINDRGFVIRSLTADNFFLLLGIIGLFAASMVAACLTRRCPVKAPKVKPALGTVSLVLGGWLVYDSVTISSPVSIPAWQTIILMLLGVLSGVLFIVYGATAFMQFEFPKAVFIVPVFYWMIRLIWVFTALNTLALTIEHILLLLNCSAILIFMLQYAKLLNSLDRDKNFKRIQITGFASVLLCADYALPNLILMAMGNRSFVGNGVSSEVTILLTSVFILFFLFAFFDEKNLKRRSKSRRRVVSHPGTGKDSFYIGGSR